MTRWLLIVLPMAVFLWGMTSAFAQEKAGGWAALRMGGKAAEQWAFIGGPWKENAQGLMSPGNTSADENLAFHKADAYGDFEAEFEFRAEYMITDAAFVFRAKDARHYYKVHFPYTGQQYRAEYFWACISKVDKSGWTKVLKTALVSGTPSEIGFWHKARVVVKGDEIRLWVNGRPFPTVRDQTYTEPGYVGLGTYSGTGGGATCSFRGLRIRGPVKDAAPWDEKVRPVRNWSHPTRDTTYGDAQQVWYMAEAPNGEVLMLLGVGDSFHGQKWTWVIIRSKDSGRTWSAQEKMTLPERMVNPAMITTRDGRLRLMELQIDKPFPILVSESKDNGRTWSKTEECGRVPFPDDVDQIIRSRPLELKDGTLLWPAVRRSTKKPDVSYYKQQHPYWCYSIRSTDGGKTWEAPVDMDGPKAKGYEKYGMIPKHFGSEPSLAQTLDGRVVAFVRSYWEPVMWETWSADGGKSWTPASRAPFGMWASPRSMVSTASGALLIAGRHPGLAFQLSYDSGLTWQCYSFDTTFWANGFALEIEPDVVMYASTAKYTDPHVRVHIFRITPDGPEPVRYGKGGE